MAQVKEVSLSFVPSLLLFRYCDSLDNPFRLILLGGSFKLESEHIPQIPVDIVYESPWEACFWNYQAL